MGETVNKSPEYDAAFTRFDTAFQTQLTVNPKIDYFTGIKGNPQLTFNTQLVAGDPIKEDYYFLQRVFAEDKVTPEGTNSIIARIPNYNAYTHITWDIGSTTVSISEFGKVNLATHTELDDWALKLQQARTYNPKTDKLTMRRTHSKKGHTEWFELPPQNIGEKVLRLFGIRKRR